MDAGRIEVSLPQDKIDSINNICQRELEYWKEKALERALDQNDTKAVRRLDTSEFIFDSWGYKECKECKEDGY